MLHYVAYLLNVTHNQVFKYCNNVIVGRNYIDRRQVVINNDHFLLFFGMMFFSYVTSIDVE